MLWIVLTMIVIVAVAVAVVLYVTFPHRREQMPHAPWVGRAMRKAVDSMPTLDNQRTREHR